MEIYEAWTQCFTPKCLLKFHSVPYCPIEYKSYCPLFIKICCFFYFVHETIPCQCQIAIIFLSVSLNMCFGCSKEPSHWDGSFEYPQHMFWLWNKKIIISYTLLSGGLVLSFFVFLNSKAKPKETLQINSNCFTV